MITAEFSADFTKFSAAVTGATAQLQSFTVDGTKVGAALGRMTDSFSGVKVVQQATLMAQAIENVGGVGSLTAKELARIAPTLQEAIDKAGRMGLEIPDALKKVQASVQDTIDKADRLGTEVPADLQKIRTETDKVAPSIGAIGSIAAQVAGPLAALFTVQSVVNFAKAVLAAGDAIQKMADQTALTTDEVQRLQYISGQTGTSIDVLISAAQDLTLKLGKDAGVARAMRDMHIEADAFTKLDLYEKIGAIAKGLQGLTDTQDRATAAEAVFGKKWKELMPAMLADLDALGAKAPVMETAGIKVTDAIGDAFTELWQQTIAYGGNLLGSLATWGTAFDDFLSRFEGDHQLGVSDSEMAAPVERYKTALAAVSPLHKLMIEEIHMIELSAKSAAAEEKIATDEVLASMEANTIAAAQAQAQADADKARLADLERAQKAYWDGVHALQDRAYGRDALILASQWADAMDSLNDDIGKLSGTMRTELAAAMTSALAAMANNGTLTDALSGRYADLLVKLDAYNDALKVQAVIVLPAASGAVTTYTQALYDQAIAEDKLRDAAAAHNAELERTQQAADAATEALKRTTQYSLSQSMPTPESLAAAAMNPGSMLGFGLPSFGASQPGWSIPTGIAPRAAGGPVSAGRTYLVGEDGPELFTAGASGGIGARSGAGGVTVTNTFNIVDTEANLARRVSAAIARTITQARKV